MSNSGNLKQRSFQGKPPDLSQLYPDLTPAEQQQAAGNLRRYVGLVWRIFERVERENPTLLTEVLRTARLKAPEDGESDP